MATTKLYVGNLPDTVKEKDLKDLFQSFGDVSEAAVLGGYGFVVSPAPLPAILTMVAILCDWATILHSIPVNIVYLSTLHNYSIPVVGTF